MVLVLETSSATCPGLEQRFDSWQHQPFAVVGAGAAAVVGVVAAVVAGAAAAAAAVAVAVAG